MSTPPSVSRQAQSCVSLIGALPELPNWWDQRRLPTCVRGSSEASSQNLRERSILRRAGMWRTTSEGVVGLSGGTTSTSSANCRKSRGAKRRLNSVSSRARPSSLE